VEAYRKKLEGADTGPTTKCSTSDDVKQYTVSKEASNAMERFRCDPAPTHCREKDIYNAWNVKGF
jgi:hypothetical protein